MGRVTPSDRTYLPGQGDLLAQVEAFLRSHTDGLARLTSADGQAVDLPAEFFEILLQVAGSMQRGLAVTVAPVQQTLSTQEAADLLGISRTTLVRLLESGVIPFDKPSRHRKIRLADLLEYKDRQRRHAEQALADLVGEAEAMGLYDVPEERIRAAVRRARRRPER